MASGYQLYRVARIDGPSPVLASQARKHALVYGVVTYPPMTPMVFDAAAKTFFAVAFSEVGGAVLPAFPIEVAMDEMRSAARDVAERLAFAEARRRRFSSAFRAVRPLAKPSTRD